MYCGWVAITVIKGSDNRKVLSGSTKTCNLSAKPLQKKAANTFYFIIEAKFYKLFTGSHTYSRSILIFFYIMKMPQKICSI